MSKKKPIVRERKIAIDPNPRGNLKALGGAQYDDWNNWLASRTSPAVKGWKVCRMHGARGGAPEGEKNGNYKHGARTKEMIALPSLGTKLFQSRCSQRSKPGQH